MAREKKGGLGAGRAQKGAEKNKGRTQKTMAANFKGVFLCKGKKPEQNLILLDTRVKSLLFGFLSLEKRDEKRKSFFVVTLVESFLVYFCLYMRSIFLASSPTVRFFLKTESVFLGVISELNGWSSRVHIPSLSAPEKSLAKDGRRRRSNKKSVEINP
jgi:hypothetical protein